MMESNANVEETNVKESKEEKQKDSKYEEQILKSLHHCTTTDEKFNLLVKKAVELEKENKKLNTVQKQYKKRFDALLREKDNLQKDHNKGILMRNKLEQVCREQQNLIKSVRNESLTKIRQEEEKRKLNQAKFEQSLSEITLSVAKTQEQNQKLKDDNLATCKKFKHLADQYLVRDQQFDKIQEQVQLESQLCEAKLAKAKMEAAIEKETLTREKEALLEELVKCRQSICDMQSRETALKEQLNLYTSKYDSFQTSLQKSNDIFVTYKSEIEKMTKTIRKLEKESMDWKRKCEKSYASLLELSTENQARNEDLTKCTRQIEQLQKLLRTLQAERTILHQVLKENNIERPPVPVLPADPEPLCLAAPRKPATDKMDLMAKNCAELKETLSKLQGQMNAITNKQEKDTPETKKSKPRKGRNKKTVAPKENSNENQNEKETIQSEENVRNDSISNCESVPETLPAMQCVQNENNLCTDQLQDDQVNETNTEIVPVVQDGAQPDVTEPSASATELNLDSTEKIDIVPPECTEEQIENKIELLKVEQDKEKDNLSPPNCNANGVLSGIETETNH